MYMVILLDEINFLFSNKNPEKFNKTESGTVDIKWTTEIPELMKLEKKLWKNYSEKQIYGNLTNKERERWEELFHQTFI